MGGSNANNNANKQAYCVIFKQNSADISLTQKKKSTLGIPISVHAHVM